jgi:FkbM family methyltransferase
MYHKLLAEVIARVPSSIKYKLSWVRPLYVRLLRLRGPVVMLETRAGSLRWVVNAMISQTYIRGAYEPYMQTAFLEVVQPGSVVFDVGAHAGFHSLFCALLVQPEGQVIAFEPNPANRASMQEQLAQNPNLPVTLLPYALSDHDGASYLDTSKGSSEGRIASAGNVAVTLRAIDSLVREGLVPPPDVMKVDVEGHEVEVLRGALATISEYRPTILCDPNDGTTAPSISSMLMPLGYRVTLGPPILGRPH